MIAALLCATFLRFTNSAFQRTGRCQASADSIHDSTFVCPMAHRQSPLWADSSAIADSVFGPKSALWAAWWRRVTLEAEPRMLERNPVPRGKVGMRDTLALPALPWSGLTFVFIVTDHWRGKSCPSNEVVVP